MFNISKTITANVMKLNIFFNRKARARTKPEDEVY